MARKALRKTPGAVTGRIGGLFISLRPCSVVPSGCSHNCASCVGAAQQWSNRRCRVMPACPRCCPSPLTLTHWLCCRGRLAFLQSRVAGFVQMRLSSAAATSAGGSSQHMRVRLLLLFFFSPCRFVRTIALVTWVRVFHVSHGVSQGLCLSGVCTYVFVLLRKWEHFLGTWETRDLGNRW